MPPTPAKNSRYPDPAIAEPAGEPKKKRGRKSKPVVEFPEPISTEYRDPEHFHEALALHMKRHGDSAAHLHQAVVRLEDRADRKTIWFWAAGLKVPRTIMSLDILMRIERRYRLPSGYFKAKLPNSSSAARGHKTLTKIPPAERRRLAWHLPDDFDRRSAKDREEILNWVRAVVISGATDYRRYQAGAMRHRFAIRFPALKGAKPKSGSIDVPDAAAIDDLHIEPVNHTIDAPPVLADEVAELIRFKTATLTDIGFQRNGVWNEQTALQKIEHLGLLFGALAASPRGSVAGKGVPLDKLTIALLIFPAVWDWYVQWRERKRGFYTVWEVNMLQLALSFARVDTGWLRQHPEVGTRLQPIPGLITRTEIDVALSDWSGACDAFYKHGLARAKEIERVARVHRDPFEPIMPVLEADSPVGEYRRITEEILRLMPDRRRYPRPAAEATRAFLMLRFGLHLGLRQRNLRELLLCPRGKLPTPERQLEARKRGELRWSEREHGWEVLIPASAFKNSGSSFFANKPFRLVLPDLADLYRYIDAYIMQDRATLLNGSTDPGTFFVKTVKATSRDASYNQSTFYEAWRLAIQRYGIYNPYTGRGAIKGLLPHGPHNVRDVLATHILKQTGSYEQASYAIQDTPEIVAKHYGRFLPQDKASLAAQVLNRVWEAA